MDLVIPQRALISVYNKEGILPFARFLQKKGVEIISTGGTGLLLKKGGVKVRDVAYVTKFPEMMGGRVKTLHPRIHGGILAVRNNKSHVAQARAHKIPMIDLVVVNLYPFQETVEELDLSEEKAIEQIDVGGPTLLRSAAKNYHFVTAVCDIADYELIRKELLKYNGIRFETRKKLAVKVFEKTCRYDQAISEFLRGRSTRRELLNLHYEKVASLRYGENPQQKAAFFRNPENKDANVTNAKVLQGKQLSFNNILDADSAIELVKEFSRPTAVFVKHNNPCGVASSKTIERAFDLAYDVDRMAAFGCVIALNRTCSAGVAQYVAKHKLFVEIIAAPHFDKKALKIFSKRPNLRLLEIGTLVRDTSRRDLRKVAGGILVQTADTYVIQEKDLRCVSKKKMTKKLITAMLFACRVVKHVKSNAVVFANIFGDDEVTTGIGAGQMSRVDAVFIGCHKGGKRVPGSVMASDAFLPFPDAVDEAHTCGVCAIVQPGGSIRDQEVIQAADRYGMVMVFTGIRTFKH